ncbi:GH1 family beta-glucosidase [Thalassotalea nanhaiensis]|uniref:Beta-glucosidase n=1 Tax=Thalassotalea nanhaiensis TaxID=3065648 RepID=A0ABY9TNS8_9GAMM|nr:GH1 family beta-glucosidase [Colwelliaceae bacterium SQ345]
MKISLPQRSKMLSKNFLYGVATASFQIEGGINSRLPCIWDTFCQKEGTISDKSDGSIACDHYNLWQQDIELIDKLGVDAYRLSISWPRVMNQDGSANQQGLDFYIKLLDGLNAKGIKPFVTLYHWDLPQYLEDTGGWLNRETAYKFAEYAKLVTTALGNRVHSYATFNEPFCSAYLGYEVGVHAPGKVGKEYGRKAAHHILLAHGLAMDVLNKYSPDSMNGIVLNFTPAYPATDSPEDLAATKFADDYNNQWYIKPLFDGRYPDTIDLLDDAHKPDIVDGDMDIICKKMDFLGVNFYTREVFKADAVEPFMVIPPENVPLTDMGWEIYPQAFTELLTSLNEKYQLPPIYITENGCAMPDTIENEQVDDQNRIAYYQQHLNALHDAIEQGVNVKGYFAWSLMDNFEWALGYSKRFGIVYVDYETQQRTVKASGQAYSDLLAQRS